MNKVELLATIQSDRAQLDDLLATLSAVQMCLATMENAWSIKDVLAHIATWERRCMGWIQAGLRGERPDIPVAGNTLEEVDRFNEKTFWRTGIALLMMC